MSDTTIESTRPAEPSERAHRRRWWALLVIALGQLMVVFDVTIVNVALPSMGQALDIPSGDHHWVITAYTLSFAGLLLVGGRVADHMGRRRSFLIALAGFAAASAVGGASVNLGMLVAARVAQGAFGALLAPAALSLVATTFPDPKERGRAFGVFGVVMGGGSGVGLVLGGLITEFLSWRWVMYVNTPLALAAAVGAVFVLTESRSSERHRIDLVGAAFATAGLVTLVYGFSAVASHGWTAPLTMGMFAVGIASLVVFVAVEKRLAQPLLPMRILTHRSRGGAYVAFTLVMIGMFGMFLLVSFYLQTVKGYSALQAGVAFLPFAVGTLIASTLIGRVMTRPRAGLPLGAGLLLAAAGMAWLTQLGVDSGYVGHVLPAVMLIGLGVGTMSPVAANLATFELPESESGIASAVFNASEQVGASMGLAVLSTIAATSTNAYIAMNQHAGGDELAALVHGYTTATAWAAGILGFGAIVVVILVNARLGHTRDTPADRTMPTPEVTQRQLAQPRNVRTIESSVLPRAAASHHPPRQLKVVGLQIGSTSALRPARGTDRSGSERIDALIRDGSGPRNFAFVTIFAPLSRRCDARWMSPWHRSFRWSIRMRLVLVDVWKLSGQEGVGAVLVPTRDVVGVAFVAEVDDAYADYRELCAPGFLDDGERYCLEVVTLTHGADGCGGAVPGLAAGAARDGDVVVVSVTGEVVGFSADWAFDLKRHRVYPCSGQHFGHGVWPRRSA